MARFQALLSSIVLALAFSSSVQAAPSPFGESERLATRNVIKVGRRGLEIEAFHPLSTFETFGEGIEQPESFAKPPLSEEATQYVAEKLKVDRNTVRYKSGFTSGKGIRHAYVHQSANGIPFANAVANVAFKDNKVISFGSSFVKPKRIASSTPKVKLEDVLPAVEQALDGKYNGHPTRLEYLARPDGSASLVHVAQIENIDENTWFEAFIDAHSGELISAVDFTADVTYRVLPIQKQQLPDGLEVLVDPQDELASPSGWHGSGTALTTQGNNVVAFKGTQTNLTVGSPAQVFDFTYDDSLPPAVTTNVDSARTNAFYIVNKIHDFAYRYGFTESAFNFQNDNFGKGGLGNDRITISVQDASGTNNANFATPPDGQSGRCRMYIWTTTNPNRDGSLQNDIIVHEVGHGISNRLTGGGTGRCLQTTEAGGMGEGWSDALAEWTQHKSEAVPDYVLAPYVTNNPIGIRTRPYSTNSTTNPQLYSTVRNLSQVHRIGEVWANILHNVYAALVARHGWSPAAQTNPDGLEGNIVYLHLFLDGLALQPCNPTFVNARDSWIQADVNRYGGANRCLLWRAFASRGLGFGAANFVDSFNVPADCVDDTTEND